MEPVVNTFYIKLEMSQKYVQSFIDVNIFLYLNNEVFRSDQIFI